MQKYIQNIYLHYLLYKNRCLEAAAWAERHAPQSALLPYIYHRLGMHNSVLQCPISNNALSKLGRIVALAATGHLQEAEHQVQQALANKTFKPKESIRLAKELAAYSPALALQILHQHPGSVQVEALKIAFLSAMGDYEQARNLWHDAHFSTPYPCPDLALLKANIFEEAAEQRIQTLSPYLRHFGLEPLALKQADKPFNVMNIQAPCPTYAHESLVSVLVTTHNNAARLPFSIQSLQQQTHQNLEIIVIDDASTDHTKALVQAMMQDDPRIRYLALDKNVGTFVAKTQGLQFAKGEFITCQDSDDWAHPRKIQEQLLPLLEDQTLVFTLSQWIRVSDDGLFYARQCFPLLRMNPASPLFRKERVLSKTKAWDKVRVGADSEFIERLKLVFGEKSYRHIKKPLTLGAHRNNSLMTNNHTGYDEHGVSLERLAYWENWHRKHIEMLK